MMMMVEKMMIENDDDDGCKNEKSPPLFSRGLFYRFRFFLYFLEKQEKKSIFFSRPFVWESYFTCT